MSQFLNDMLYKLYDRNIEYYDIQDCNEQDYYGRTFKQTALRKETIKTRNLNKNSYSTSTFTPCDRVRYFQPQKFYIKLQI